MKDSRRKFIKNLAGGFAILPALGATTYEKNKSQYSYVSTGLKKPASVYINWASYDELSDNIPLTEQLALKQLNELIRLKKLGVQLDYYIMDMFWFDKDGAYRKWRRESWPNGPDKWLKKCLEAGIKPGLWFSTNMITVGNNNFLSVPEVWEDSLSRKKNSLCLFSGGYLTHLIESLQIYYDKGFRAFKFDFADFGAASVNIERTHLPSEIIDNNITAFINALKEFRLKNNEAIFLAYNGYGGDSSNTSMYFRKTVNPKWLEVFDSLYCGDPRPADVPCMNFWRSKDIYSDHMVRQYEFNGIPLNRIDNTAFMIGNSGTCYYRNKAAWKGMLLLSLARGGWMNTYYGDLQLLNEEDAKWFSKAQQLFYPFQEVGKISTFGGVPGEASPYGYLAKSTKGSIFTIVNPSQAIQEIELPTGYESSVSLLYSDSGFTPSIKKNKVILGPEQLALIGTGEFDSKKYKFGIGEDIKIPVEITPADFSFNLNDPKSGTGKIKPLENKSIRLVFQQRGFNNNAIRTSGGSYPDGKDLGKLLKIKAFQDEVEIPVKTNYDKIIWSGLSWAVGEIDIRNINLEKVVLITFETLEPQNLEVEAKAYYVKYNS